VRLNLSRTIRTTRAVPQWLLSHVRLLARLPHILPLEDVAPPVWRLPRGVRTAAVVFSLIGLVCGVRVLDAQIADLGPPATGTSDAAPLIPILLTGPPVAEPEPTVMIVEHPPDGDTHRFLLVTVTGYTSAAAQTDDSPTMTASSRHARPGTVALSRDLLRTFTPGAPFDFGDRVLIPGMGMYVVDDTMSPRWTRMADIWFADLKRAKTWGRRDVYLTLVDAGEPLLVSERWHP
jgi:3D (Asp-Asp-Asp) domain-containing protein